MLEELYCFTRERLTTWRQPRVPRRVSWISDEVFCEQYVSACRDSDFRVIQAFVLERVLAGLPQHGEALDVCCGPGLLLGEFARRRPNVAFTGLDVSPAILALAQQHLEQEKITNVRLLEGNMARLPEIFGDRRFDSITWTFGISYCPTSEQALATINAMADLLKPGGFFFLVDLARFKREATRRWFSEKHDRDHGQHFLEETTATYLAAFAPEELTQLLRASRFSGLTQEWSKLCPILLLADNRGSGQTSPVQIDLPWRERLKYAMLRRILNGAGVRSSL
ncbi:class I SAM-dependent methyltransferase [Propionivibrio sp.]|uniref:class I SAM-dependent methyltransferase n=1 Tax=Propionivibrio sp. TaxID=2212460 RepID=UPI0026186A51|nr:class I SAM-dependent methyltransferase [Propionivibrio sp.]